MTRFFTSDTHFCHKNIIRYENRPFISTDEMDKILIHNWNAKVGKNDEVYHLGDFAFASPRFCLMIRLIILLWKMQRWFLRDLQLGSFVLMMMIPLNGMNGIHFTKYIE